MAITSLLQAITILPAAPHKARIPPHLMSYPSLRINYKLHATNNLLNSKQLLPLDKPEASSHEKYQRLINDFATKASNALKIPLVSALMTGVIFASSSYMAALAASGGVMGGSSFSSYSSSSSSPSSSSSFENSSSASSYSYSSSSQSDSSSSSSYENSSSSTSSSTSSSSYYDCSYSSASFDSYSEPENLMYSSSSSWYSDDSSSNSKSYSKTNSSKSTSSESSFKLSGNESYTASIAAETGGVSQETESFYMFCALLSALVVSLLGMARSFQNDLNQIAEKADTWTQKGFRNILTESSLSLIRYSQYWASSHLYVSVGESVERGEKLFSKLSFDERSKFDQETLVNLDNNEIMKQENMKQDSEDPGHEFIVVTFLVAALGIFKLSTVNNPSDLRTVLKKLTSLFDKEILAIQVLWPQEENETLSSQRVLQDYPLLKPL